MTYHVITPHIQTALQLPIHTFRCVARMGNGLFPNTPNSSSNRGSHGRSVSTFRVKDGQRLGDEAFEQWLRTAHTAPQ